MTWGKWICTACATIGTACVCVATGGLAAPAILGYAATAGAVGFFTGDVIDKEKTENEKRLMKNQRYKDAKGEIDRQTNENNQTEDAINTIIGKLNGDISRQPHETDEHLRSKLIIHESQLDSGKTRLNQLNNDLDKLRKDLIDSGNLMSLLGLDKLKFMDKVMIAGGIVLVIYLLK